VVGGRAALTARPHAPLTPSPPPHPAVTPCDRVRCRQSKASHTPSPMLSACCGHPMSHTQFVSLQDAHPFAFPLVCTPRPQAHAQSVKTSCDHC
jgi:hypothetical protein